MELDELKNAWRELDRRVEVIELRQERAQKEVKLSGTRTLLRRFGALLLVELLFNIPAVVLLGSFLANHLDEVRFVWPTLVLLFAALASIAVNIQQLGLISRIDYAQPVLEIQRQLAHVRLLRTRSTQWTFLLAPLLWTPLALVCAQAFLGLDLYAGLGLPYVMSNLAFGLVLIPLGIWAARLCVARLGHSPLLQRVADSVAGNSLTRAQASVYEIQRFEEEL